MDAVKYFKLKARMTNANERGECNTGCCDVCKLSSTHNGKHVYCLNFELVHPKEAVEIIEKWAAEHPAKTRQSEFLKMFPNASKDMNGDLIICPQRIDTNFSCAKISCEKCCKEYWLEEIED